MLEREQRPQTKLSRYIDELTTWTPETSRHAHSLNLLPEQKLDQDIRQMLTSIGPLIEIGELPLDPQEWSVFKAVMYQRVAEAEAAYHQNPYNGKDTMDRQSIPELRAKVDAVVQLGDEYIAAHS